MAVRRAFVNILCADPGKSRAFYQDLLGCGVTFESDWFVHLALEQDIPLELGLLRRDHEVVPASGVGEPRGLMLTLVVDDVDVVHARARELGARIVETPRNLFYGQRRMVIQDPDGTLLDVSSECPPDPAWMRKVHPREGGGYVER